MILNEHGVYLNSLMALMHSMVNRMPIVIYQPGGMPICARRVMEISLEDGSGRLFNITYQLEDGKKYTSFIHAV